MKTVILPGNHRPAKTGAKRLCDVARDAKMEVTLDLRGPEFPKPEELPRKGLSSKAFEEKYGAKEKDAKKVASCLKKFGLNVEAISLPTRSMRVSGTASAMQAAFKAKLGIYKTKEQGEYRGREGDVRVPEEIEGLVKGVYGLDQRRVARRIRQMRSSAPASASRLAPLAPSDLEGRYSFPEGDSKGQKIAIAEFSDGNSGCGYFAEDVTAFCAKYRRTMPTIKIVPVGVTPLTLAQIQALPPADQEDPMEVAGEVMMDVEIVAALCPGAQVSVYFSTFDQKGWVDLLNAVIMARPVALSVSYGLAEDSPDWSPAALKAINDRLSAAATLGITVCVSSGDDGTGAGVNDSAAHVEFPSSSPYVLSVGGTMLKSGDGTSEEVVWWTTPGWRKQGTDGGAGGGGVSAVFSRPQWQNVRVPSLNADSIDGRVLPDVAALAGSPYYDLIFTSRDAPNGGTSASAPLWASLITRVNSLLPSAQRQRFFTPFLYEAGTNGNPIGSSACQDITSGQNATLPKPGKGYQAGPGFDAVSGWGTPNGQALLKALQSTSGKAPPPPAAVPTWPPANAGAVPRRGTAKKAKRGQHAERMALNFAAVGIDTNAVVNGCINNAANGAGWGSDTPFSAIPINPDDMIYCLNNGLDLGAHHYTRGSIDPGSTPRMLRTDASNRYALDHP